MDREVVTKEQFTIKKKSLPFSWEREKKKRPAGKKDLMDRCLEGWKEFSFI